jgi:sugar O-acyltransferase (sialic acid O-acetyltransferase NeuD family)
VGAGDHGRVVLELLRAAGENPSGFVQPNREGAEARDTDGLALIGNLDGSLSWVLPGMRFVVALGDNLLRRDVYQACLRLGLAPVTAVHPTAILLSGARIEPGAMVCAGAVVGVAAKIGANAIVNTSSSVDHDGSVGPHAQVAPGARLAGRVTVGEGAYIGIGSAVREGLTIGAWAVVAGGAMVVEDVPPATRVAGVPARPMGSSTA